MMKSTSNLEHALNFTMPLPMDTCRLVLHRLKQGEGYLQADEKISVKTRYVDKNCCEFIVNLMPNTGKLFTSTTLYGKLRYNSNTRTTLVTASTPTSTNQRLFGSLLMCLFLSGCALPMTLMSNPLALAFVWLFAGLVAGILWLSNRGTDIAGPRLVTIVEQAFADAKPESLIKT